MPSGASGKEVPLPPLIPRETGEGGKPGYEPHIGDDHEGNGKHPSFDPRNPYNDKSPNTQFGGNQNSAGGGGKLEGIAGYVPAQRLEWKRYKQYTRNDIMAAIEEVKLGKIATSPVGLTLHVNCSKNTIRYSDIKINPSKYKTIFFLVKS